MTLHCRCIDGLVILRIFRLITSHKVGTETIAEPLAQVKILQRLDAKLNRLWLRKRPATVGHHKIWRKVAAAAFALTEPSTCNGASADATPIAENATSVAMIDFLFIIYCFLFRE